MIESKSIIPPYMRIGMILKKRISDGEYTSTFPSTNDLVRELGVSPMTINKAVGELVREGLIYRKIGSGTFINTRKKEKKKTGRIIYFVPDKAYGLRHPFHAGVFLGMTAAAMDAGCEAIFQDSEANLLDMIFKRSKELSFDGIIFSRWDNRKMIDEISKVIPMLEIGISDVSERIPSVHFDDENGACKAVRYLIGLGHRRIAFITGYMTWKEGERRFEGYKKALREAGMIFDGSLVFEDEWNDPAGYRCASRMFQLAERPTAIFFTSDHMAFGAMPCIREKGLTIPGDISIIGFNNVEASAYVEPALTTVEIPFQNTGARAFKCMCAMACGVRPSEEELMLETRFIIRNSCCSPKTWRET
ncbi:MAG TPA: hypothetical protein DCZ94_18310 [Lentisphaeria bacterium]|nr:MAG: hypothetical protein A2X48_22875 [Lentisphaerae bacterium GWF2_49_21]HBC88900.1 hypothetical protein [Lentisphaeria bacterium]